MKTKTLEAETESNESLTITSTINKQINKFMTPPCDLLTWKDMPAHLQFNPYVHTGKSFTLCYHSQHEKLIFFSFLFSFPLLSIMKHSCTINKDTDRCKISRDV
jgi:hypothetical protein